MQAALQLAESGMGRVEPNPMVGCILVRDGQLIASGYHGYFGGPHAERAAVQAARDLGLDDRLRGCTAYVTLEPCCHQGKTAPCTDLLIEVEVARVVVAMQDPFPSVAGQGIRQLRAAGIQVDLDICSQSSRQLNAPYLKRVEKGYPWVIAKWAMSLDGRIATRTGSSQWISSPPSREIVHRLRSRMDAIIVGRGTALKDDPLLTARLPNDETSLRKALRVVVDSQLSLSPESRIARTAAEYPTLIWTAPDADRNKAQGLRQRGCRLAMSSTRDRLHGLDELLQFLVSEYSATNVLVEGGQDLLGSLADLRQIDECHVFVAPKIIGGKSAVSPIGGLGIPDISRGPACTNVCQRSSGDDIYFSCRLDWNPTLQESGNST